jgi:Putative peptidoglycan binding domain
MSRRDDPDDWFAEPEPRRPRRGRAAEDDRRGDEAAAPRAPRRTPFGDLPWRRQISIGAGAIVVLLLVLWVAGVLGGGGSAPTRPVTTTGRAAPATVSVPAPTPAQTPATVLSPGSSGPQVKRLQRALARLGYSPGRADGAYGPATENPLKRFQRANGLQPDGVLGPKTLQALKHKLASG